jgi:hypothetical protein
MLLTFQPCAPYDNAISLQIERTPIGLSGNASVHSYYIEINDWHISMRSMLHKIEYTKDMSATRTGTVGV